LLDYNYIVIPLLTGFYVSAYLNGEGVQIILTHSIKKKIIGNRYELPLEDKVYPKMYYNHQPRSVAMEENFAKIKTQDCK
jgi:hypothetical protein